LRNNKSKVLRYLFVSFAAERRKKRVQNLIFLSTIYERIICVERENILKEKKTKSAFFTYIINNHFVLIKIFEKYLFEREREHFKNKMMFISKSISRGSLMGFK